MKLIKITRQEAFKYTTQAGITAVAMEGFLYANPTVDQIYSDKDYSGLLAFDENFTLLHSPNENFLSEAYDFVGYDARFNCVDANAAKFLIEKKGAVCFSYCHILGYVNPNPPLKGRFEVPQNLTLKRIDIKDLDVINDFYTYKSENSRERLAKEIEERDSSALYDGENILAWNLLHRDYAMGVMFVPPAQRGKGYAQIVADDLMRKVIAKGKIPYVQIVDGNTPSINLAKKLGFEDIFDACWLMKHPLK